MNWILKILIRSKKHSGSLSDHPGLITQHIADPDLRTKNLVNMKEYVQCEPKKNNKIGRRHYTIT